VRTYKEVFGEEEPSLPLLKVDGNKVLLYVKKSIPEHTLNYIVWRLKENSIVSNGFPPFIRVEKLIEVPSWIPN